MERSSDKTVRSGDKARVIIPDRFVRCGYELTPAIAAEKLKSEHAEEIAVFLDSIGISRSAWTDQVFGDNPKTVIRDHRAMDRFLSGLGFLYTRAMEFGGSERKIFTQYDFALEDRTVWVMETRQVMTGIYYGPSGGWYHSPDYGMDYDFEPGGLDDRESHKICRVTFADRNDMPVWTELEHQQFEGLWIQASKLEKMEHAAPTEVS